MKITHIETHAVRIPLVPAKHMITALGKHTESPYLLVRVGTDSGIEGAGEATATPTAVAVELSTRRPGSVQLASAMLSANARMRLQRPARPARAACRGLITAPSCHSPGRRSQVAGRRSVGRLSRLAIGHHLTGPDLRTCDLRPADLRPA